MKTAKFNYDASFHPPAPVLDTLLVRPLSKDMTQAIRIDGLIDSGADITVVPQRVADQLKLYPVDEVLVAGYTGEPTRERVYSVVLIIAGFEPQFIRAVGSGKMNIALLGRDIINQWGLLLDGKQRAFEIRVDVI